MSQEVSQKSIDKLAGICLKRVYELRPELLEHEILEAWFEGEGKFAFVIKSKLTNENGTQIYFTRFHF